MANILVFGDSIASGLNDYEKGGWVDRLKRKVFSSNKKNSAQDMVYNLGVDGDTSQGVLERFMVEAMSLRSWPESLNIFIFALGINDSIVVNNKNNLVSQANFEKNIYSLVNDARKVLRQTKSEKVGINYKGNIAYVSLTPVVEEKVTPVPWTPEYGYKNSVIEKYDSIIREVCYKEKVNRIDIFEETNKKQFKQHLDDGVHPNTKGHELIYETVKKFLKKNKYI